MREGRVRRLLSVLLMLYPPSFRRALGDDLIETALHRRRDSRLAFWWMEVPRFALDGVLERLRALPLLLDDIRHAWRQLRRAPGHHGLAIITLALGVGATTTIFTVADAVVFRPLPYADADRLYLIHSRFGDLELGSNSLLNLRSLQGSATTMSWLAGAHDWSPALTDNIGAAERISALNVTHEYLPRLSARVRAGRAFDTGDFAAGAERVAIVSDALWQRRWGGNASVLGRAVQLDGTAYTVVGVMSPSFRDPEPIESGALTGAWIPTREVEPRFANVDDYAFRLIGGLAERSSLEAARQELSAAGKRLAAEYPVANRVDEHDLEFVLHPLREATVGDARARLLLLLGAVILLLVLSCANVANLFMARGLTRTSELAVRSALGATRARLASQLFGESLLTALFAGAVGGILGVIGLRIFVAYAPSGIPRLHEVNLDVRALLFVSALTVICAVVFGTLPALRGARAGSAAASGVRTTASRSAQRFQSGLVALEVAISLVLVTGSALLLNSFMRLLRVDPGFDGSDVVVVDVRAPASANSHAQELVFYRSLMERASALPGVAHAALALTMPGLSSGAWTPVTVENAATAPATGRSRAPAYGSAPGAGDRVLRWRTGREFFRFNAVYGDFLEVLDIPLRAGRAFEDPGEGEALVVIVNEAAVERFFPGVDAIGQRLKLGPPDADVPFREVVGIVGDVRQLGSGHEADPQIYVPYGQRDIPRLALILEVTPGAQVTVDAMRSVVREVAADVPVDRMESLATSYATTADQTRFLTFLISVFAAIGLVLAVVGTYATASHAVSRRLRELGIRIALGARASAVFRLVLERALVAAGVGIAGGLLIALALARYLESYVYGVTARDPLTVAVAAVLIGACATLASLGPAVRAARVDPNEVLRRE